MPSTIEGKEFFVSLCRQSIDRIALTDGRIRVFSGGAISSIGDVPIRDQWSAILQRKVPVAGWLAIKNPFSSFDLHAAVDAIRRRLGEIDLCRTPREDIPLSDEQLLHIAREQQGQNLWENKDRPKVITDPDAWRADAQWTLKEWSEGRFNSQKDDYVAVYSKTILGTGNDPNELRKKWSEDKKVPFQRIIVQYVKTED